MASRLPAVLYVAKGDMKVTALPEDTPKLSKQITAFITSFAGEVREQAGAVSGRPTVARSPRLSFCCHDAHGV
jgi:hypothetical protein